MAAFTSCAFLVVTVADGAGRTAGTNPLSPMSELLPAPRCGRRRIHIPPGDHLARESLRLHQVSQRILHLDVQGGAELIGGVAFRRAIHPRFKRANQGALTREPDSVHGPQPALDPNWATSASV